MKKSLSILKTIAIQLLIFTILVAMVNWAAGAYLAGAAKNDRSRLPNFSSDREHAAKVFSDYNSVQHEYEPFVGWKMLPYNGATLNVSKNGERENPIVCSAKDSARSVHFFGGSTMWGEGSDDDHTIPARFNAANPRLKVFNHGQLAYNSRQELDALISLYSTGEKMDIVVFYDGVNDAAFLCPSEIKELPAHRLVPMYREKLYAGKSQIAKDILSKIFFENTLKVVRKLSDNKENKKSPYDCVSNPQKAEQIAEIMMRNWELAHEIVTRRNGKFVAFLQPAAFIGKPRIDHLKLDTDLGENFKAIYGRLKAKIKERNHPWIIDLTDRFDGEEYIYIDFCHVSPNGNEIIAREISKALTPTENKVNQDVSLLAIHP